MFDTMTFTKVVGGFCGALLVFLLGKWAGETIYHVGDAGHGEEHTAAWVIETGEEDAGAEEEAPADFASLWANADADAGERVFNSCRACHQLEEGANAVGPYLYGVVGREIGSADGYGSYSGALSEQGADVWDPETLSNFLENPQGWAPGTSMSYSGVKDAEDRVNLIAYLNTFGGNAEVGAPAEGGDAAGSEEEAAAGDDAASEEQATEEAAAEDAPAEEQATEEAAAEEAPAEEQASDEAAAEEAPAQEQASDDAAAEEQATEEAAAEEAPADAGGDAGSAILANADAAAGERVFNKCRACHKVDGTDGVGPHLNGVVGREVDSVEGYNYSGALEEAADVWTPENLDAFLENPRGYAPGTKMSFAGLRSEEERANVIAYLQSTGN